MNCGLFGLSLGQAKHTHSHSQVAVTQWLFSTYQSEVSEWVREKRAPSPSLGLLAEGSNVFHSALTSCYYYPQRRRPPAADGCGVVSVRCWLSDSSSGQSSSSSEPTEWVREMWSLKWLTHHTHTYINSTAWKTLNSTLPINISSQRWVMKICICERNLKYKREARKWTECCLSFLTKWSKVKILAPDK